MRKLYIKNMVCDRCINSVKAILENKDISFIEVKLGEVSLDKEVDESTMSSLSDQLDKVGFDIIDSTTPILVNQIKSALINFYNQSEIPEEFKLSSFLTQQFSYDYSHLSRLFSHHENDTIEHFVIRLRIEKAKELLTYNKLNVSEVAYKLGYASNAHFSRQFKKLVGITPSKFKDNPSGRKSIDNI